MELLALLMQIRPQRSLSQSSLCFFYCPWEISAYLPREASPTLQSCEPQLQRARLNSQKVVLRHRDLLDSQVHPLQELGKTREWSWDFPFWLRMEKEGHSQTREWHRNSIPTLFFFGCFQFKSIIQKIRLQNLQVNMPGVLIYLFICLFYFLLSIPPPLEPCSWNLSGSTFHQIG